MAEQAPRPMPKPTKTPMHLLTLSFDSLIVQLSNRLRCKRQNLSAQSLRHVNNYLLNNSTRCSEQKLMGRRADERSSQNMNANSGASDCSSGNRGSSNHRGRGVAREQQR